MFIYDTHAHLDHIEDLDGALRRAADSGVRGIVAPGMDLASCEKLPGLALRGGTPRIYYALGIHPSEAGRTDLSAVAEHIRRRAGDLAAVGEIGLDFWYKWARRDEDKKAEQRGVFRALIEQAKEINLPAVIHSRGCWRECFETARAVGLEKAEFHWYSGPLDVLKDILDAGYFVSTSPSVAFSPQSREAMAYAPVEQTMIETDSPVFYKDREADSAGFKSEPKDVWKTLEAYAALKGLDRDQALDRLNSNAEYFFGIERE
jgi:TatD DNase family protein